MRDMVKDHTKDVAEFKHAALGATNPDVKNFAQQTLLRCRIIEAGEEHRFQHG